MPEFNAILLEGVFYTSDEPYPDSNGVVRDGWASLLVQQEGGAPESVYETLRPFVGQRVQIAVHHLPDMPPNPTLWGGGSCLWQNAGHCPFGHHQNPFQLFNVSGQGFLEYDLDHTKGEGGWWLTKLDGGREMLPLQHVLAGHRGRIACATAMTVEEMRDALIASGQFDSIDALGQRVGDLRDLVAGISKATKGE